MKKRNVFFINQEDAEDMVKQGIFLIYRPMCSKLFRAFLPEQFAHRAELVSLLNLWSNGRRHKGVWYIAATDQEMQDFLETIYFIGVVEDIALVHPSNDVWHPSVEISN